MAAKDGYCEAEGNQVVVSSPCVERGAVYRILTMAFFLA